MNYVITAGVKLYLTLFEIFNIQWKNYTQTWGQPHLISGKVFVYLFDRDNASFTTNHETDVLHIEFLAIAN